MQTLYHFPLCPFSRKVRVVLKEKGLNYELIKEDVWKRRHDFMRINPANDVPVLVEQDGSAVSDHNAICEYLEEAYPERSLLGETPLERAEVRRIVGWFDRKFYQEVTQYVLAEKVYRYYLRDGQPDSEVIRAAKHNICYHLDYIAFLTQKNQWLAGGSMTLADIAAACHISVLDYLGDVPWQVNDEAKEWYVLMKSRPSFRPILADKVAGFLPYREYANLDF